MEIKNNGGMNFNLKGSRIENISDYTSEIQRCLIPLGKFNFDYRNILKRDNAKRGEILFRSDHNYLIAPISGKLNLLKNDVLEIVADAAGETSRESLDLLKDKIDYSVLVRLGLLKDNVISNLKNVIVKLNHTEPFFIKDSILIKHFSPFLENTFGVLDVIFPEAKKKIIYSDRACEKYFSEKMEAVRIKDKYPFDNEILLQSRLGGDKDFDPKETLFIPFEKLIVIYNYIKNEEPPTSQYLSIAGNIDKTGFIKVPLYSDIEKVSKLFIPKHKKFSDYDVIVGGPFSGRLLAEDPFLNPNDLSITLLENNRPRKLWGFMRPGLKEHTNSRAFVSTFLPSQKDIDSMLHGERRACVFCGFCEEVCPVNIEPFVLFKHIEIDALEEAKMYNISDCIECGLCTHVCPSKIPISEIIINGKMSINKEKI